MPSLEFVLPHWLYWAGLILFPLIAMYVTKRRLAAGEDRRVQVSIAYLLWLLGGFVGLHRFYLRSRWGLVFIPLFALVLRFDRFGRLALPDEDMVASTWMAVCLLTSEVSVLAGLLARNWGFVVPAVGALAMLVPVAGVFHASIKAGRAALIIYDVLMTLVLGLASIAAVIGPFLPQRR